MSASLACAKNIPPVPSNAQWIVVSVTGIEMCWEPETQRWKPYVGVSLPPQMVIYERAPTRPPQPKPSKRRPGQPSLVVKRRVKERDGYRCVWCLAGEREFLTVDHIQPKSKGGSDKVFNLQTLCRQCNTEKADGPNVISEGAKRRRLLNEERAA